MNMRLVDPLGERIGPSPDDHSTIGEYLRALREHRGLTLTELAGSTRIRRAYLQGIEEGDRSSQPARPFAIGYVRSYAQALGIDGDAAAARFKKETPDLAEPFRDPVGVAHEKPKRSPLIFACIGLVLSGVVLWNVVQRTMQQEDHEAAAMPAASTLALNAPTNTVVAIGASTPAPAAQNLPEPYVTPGLPGAPDADGKPGGAIQAATALAPVAPELPATFTPKGAVYGAPPSPSAIVVLQAKKPGSLIVRGAGGAVYFARQLTAGESYRAPSGEGLTGRDRITDPAAFNLYVAGDNKGALVSQQTALDKLAVRPTTASPARTVPVSTTAAAPIAAPAVHATRPTPAFRRPRQPAQPQTYYEPAPNYEPQPQGQVAYYPQPRG
jgi:cytoskeleton protein RodZ